MKNLLRKFFASGQKANQGKGMIFFPDLSAICPHDVPENAAFEHYGAVYKGDICSWCGKLVQGEVLGNAWKKEEQCTHMVLDREAAMQTPEGKKLDEEFWKAFHAARDADERHEIYQKHSQRIEEIAKQFPLKESKYIYLEGLDFSKFEKQGYRVRRIP